jgi:2-oxoglutarate ferredoxin oxidoreductase subunit alpha
MGEARLVQGNEACALGAIAAGCRFYAGYPITPSSEIAETMAELLPRAGGVFVQMEDEIASLAACLGASLGGAKSMTATSGPGFSLMQEHIGFAAMAEIPSVIVNVMRAGPSTGLPTSPAQGDIQQARWGTHGDRPAIVLASASVREVFHETVRAFSLAERFRTPVVLLHDEAIGHLRERVEIPESVPIVGRTAPDAGPYRPYAAGENLVPPLSNFGDGPRYHVTGLAHDEDGFPTQDGAVVAAMNERRHRKISARIREIESCESFLMEDAEVAVVAIGIVARAAREAVRESRRRGVKAGLLRPVTLWPFPQEALREAAARVGGFVVAEMNLGQMALEVERVVGASRVRGCFQADGELIDPETILAAIERMEELR